MEIHDGSTPIQHAVLKHARAQATLRAGGFAPIAFQARSTEMRFVLRAGRTQQPAVLAFKRVRRATDREHACNRARRRKRTAARDAQMIAHEHSFLVFTESRVPIAAVPRMPQACPKGRGHEIARR